MASLRMAEAMLVVILINKYDLNSDRQLTNRLIDAMQIQPNREKRRCDDYDGLVNFHFKNRHA